MTDFAKYNARNLNNFQVSCAEGCCVTDSTQTQMTPNALNDSIQDIYKKGFAAGVGQATSQLDKDNFIAGQLHAYDLILTGFSHAHANLEMQVVLQYVANLKKETLNKQPKEMDID